MFEYTCPKCGIINKEDGTRGCSCARPIMAMHTFTKLIELAPLIVTIFAILFIYDIIRHNL